jgi:hypothetical protein
LQKLEVILRGNFMSTFIIIIVLGVIAYFIFRNKNKSTLSEVSNKNTQNSELGREPRNYLREATSFVNAPGPLDVLIINQRNEVIHNLIDYLNLDADIRHETGIPMGPTIRKAAAYALGQIGDVSTLNVLQNRLNIERASGVKEAIVASISAINIAPDPLHTQMERRKIIEDVYNNRRPAQLSSWSG